LIQIVVARALSPHNIVMIPACIYRCCTLSRLRQEVELPAELSAEVKHFIGGLLERRPSKRLGSRRGAADIRAHTWFATLDWQALADQQITPPFKPPSQQVLLEAHRAI
jgi:hypothetical protein